MASGMATTVVLKELYLQLAVSLNWKPKNIIRIKVDVRLPQYYKL